MDYPLDFFGRMQLSEMSLAIEQIKGYVELESTLKDVSGDAHFWAIKNLLNRSLEEYILKYDSSDVLLERSIYSENDVPYGVLFEFFLPGKHAEMISAMFDKLIRPKNYLRIEAGYLGKMKSPDHSQEMIDDVVDRLSRQMDVRFYFLRNPNSEKWKYDPISKTYVYDIFELE